jgi:2'-5' RNA ligase
VESGNKYMLDNDIPPHLTLSLFRHSNIDEIQELIDKNIFFWNPINIKLSSIGIFNPNVLFLTPVPNNSIIELNQKTNELLIKSNENINIDKNYATNNWVPHIALAVKLNQDELINGIKIITREYEPIGGEINRIALAKCNPYKDIKIWDLKIGK